MYDPAGLAVCREVLSFVDVHGLSVQASAPVFTDVGGEGRFCAGRFGGEGGGDADWGWG
jgi:hypothetical protein